MSLPAPVPTSWWRGFVFRLGFVFGVLSCFYFVGLNWSLFDWQETAFSSIWQPVANWIARHLLGITAELQWQTTGSGDRTVDWVSLFSVFALTVVSATAWAFLDRRRAQDARLRGYLRVLVRYSLASEMVNYGLAKIFCLQFGTPSVNHLLQPYGQSSPMGLLWTFVAQSSAYQIFGGVMELIGGLLLFSRRTTTLGALVLVPVLLNVVMLNFCYDVPVKINSSFYFAMSVWLMLPDVRRLADLLWFHRQTEAAAPQHRAPEGRRWIRLGRPILKWSTVAILLITPLHDRIKARVGRDQPSWYAGYWQVTKFVRDGREIPAVVDEPTRWQRIRLQPHEGGTWMRGRLMNSEYGPLFDAVFDEAHHRLRLKVNDEEVATYPNMKPIDLAYTRRDAIHLHLEGLVDGSQLVVELTWIDGDGMPLRTRGFHWINEEPFNS